MTIKLFISYRSLDSAKVDAMVARLKTIQKDKVDVYKPWQDKHNIPVGKDWWEAIVDAIIDSEIFVFNISKAALASDVCRAELAYAYRRNRPIVPVVLEGEYNYNTTTGKFDLDYWDKIPDELNNLRAQFLFYEGVSFFPKFEAAIMEFQRKNQRDTPASRPLNPDATGGSKTNHALYDEGCEYAGHLAFDEAEKCFRRLMQGNDPDYAAAAYDWIELLNLYKDLIAADKPNTLFVFRKKWKDYTALPPKDFLEGRLFDPKDFANRANGNVGSKPVAPIVQTPPPETQAQYIAPLQTPIRTKPTSIDLMPKPFVWINIPAGKVKIEGKSDSYVKTDTIFDVMPFQIAKYPITNAQFAQFIEAGGYREKRWWTDAGWAQREKDKWTEPRYWQDKTWNGAEYPIVGVSWYECVAFCQWLKDVTGENINLATEQQWQRAAQGDKGLTYPWGNKWDAARCNNNVDKKGIGKTTPVRQYEGKGDSPYGVVDIAGNVWEWCVTSYSDGIVEINNNVNYRMLRGGSWNNDNTDGFRVAVRARNYPYFRFDYRGFRIARSI